MVYRENKDVQNFKFTNLKLHFEVDYKKIGRLFKMKY